MSFPPVASYQGGKNADLFGQCFDELSPELNHEFFDQFLNLNDNESIGYTALHTGLFPESSAIDGNSGCTSLSSSDDEGNTHCLYPGGMGEASSLYSAQTNFYAELSGRAAISDAELLSLEGIDLQSPHIPQDSQLSLPSSPSSITTASTKHVSHAAASPSRSVRKASTSNFDKALLRSPIRKSNSPKMRAASQVGVDGWGLKLEQDAAKFGYDLHEDPQKFMAPLSSSYIQSGPHSASLKQMIKESFEDDCNPLHQVSGPYHTPLSTPLLESHRARNASIHSVSSTSPSFPVTPQNPNASGLWSQLPASPPLSSQRVTGGCSEGEQPLWWNHAATAKLAQPSPSIYHNNPQRATKTLAMQLQNGLTYGYTGLALGSPAMANGLMIQMPEGETQQSTLELGSPSMQQGYFDVASPQPRNVSTPRRFAPVRLRLPPHTTSAAHKQRHSIPSDSENTLGDSQSSPTASIYKRRGSKASKPSSPRSLSLGSAVDFVNFTPSDSKRILTGVAPSGSSKTKARREKEAMEKRRRLSQAAMRAVRAAGGDIESLVGEGLLV